MAEEHGYQRSGKKCREKFENLYKYFKKTKEGKAGRQDGKNYRFFRQFEAFYGDTTTNQSTTPSPPKLSHEISLSFSNASEFETWSSTENNKNNNNNNNIDDLSAIAFMMKQPIMDQNEKKMSSGKKRWETKMEEFVETQMKKLIDSQDVWMERMLKTIEDKEKERMFKEEEWRRSEATRFDKELHQFWAKERAWVEGRDAALMDALGKLQSSSGAKSASGASIHQLQNLMASGTGMDHRS